MTEQSITKLLAARYAAPAWAFLPQVRNGTSYRRKTVRTADALAQSLWASRGLELHGFEIKVSRTDWKKELADPDKSDDIQRFCDRWWIVVGDREIVQPGELPPTWGLMYVNGRGLNVATEAPKLDSVPIDRLMFCAIVRRLTEMSVPRDSINDQIETARKKAHDDGKSAAEYRIKQTLESVKAFEEASGLKLGYSWDAGKLGSAVKFVMEHDMDAFVSQMKELKRQAAYIARQVVEQVEQFEEKLTA